PGGAQRNPGCGCTTQPGSPHCHLLKPRLSSHRLWPSPHGTPPMNRRQFLRHGATLAAGAIAAPAVLADSPGKKLVIGVMGLGRGLDHVKACRGLPDVEIAYLCDVDDRRIARAVEAVNAAKD